MATRAQGTTPTRVRGHPPRAGAAVPAAGELLAGADEAMAEHRREIDAVLDELLANGLIEVPQAAVPAPAAAASPAAVVAEIEVELPEPAKPKTKAKAEAKAKAKPEAAPPPVEAKPSMGFDPLLQAAREYMSRTLIAKAGLRSFLFAQKIEKCPSRDALREMLPEFRRVLRKHVDAGKVAEFSAQAEAMLGVTGAGRHDCLFDAAQGMRAPAWKNRFSSNCCPTGPTACWTRRPWPRVRITCATGACAKSATRRTMNPAPCSAPSRAASRHLIPPPS